MAIGFFPSVYEDELVYSVLARFYAMSGIMTYIDVARVLYEKPNARPDAEFLNKLKPDVTEAVKKQMSMEELIKKHTMLDYHGGFLPEERREKAIKSLFDMTPDYRTQLLFKKNLSQSLRYCPYCLKEDREHYGEGYWHRMHQLYPIRICPKHGCLLKESNQVKLLSKNSPCLISLETELDGKEDAEVTDNQDISDKEKSLAGYVAGMFTDGIRWEKGAVFSEWLHAKLYGTDYISRRGQQKNISRLYDDLQDCFSVFPEGYNYFKERSRLDKIFIGKSADFYAVASLMWFLGVDVKDAVKVEVIKEKQEDAFDEQIIAMHRQGIGYNRIARLLGISSNTVRKTGHYKEREPHSYTKKCGAKPKDWGKIDEEHLDAVRAIIADAYKEGERPKKITVTGIERTLGLKGWSVSKMPLCLSEIRKAEETWEHFWAREIIWQYKRMQEDRSRFNLSRLLNPINLERSQVERSLSDVKQMDEEIYRQVCRLLKESRKEKIETGENSN